LSLRVARRSAEAESHDKITNTVFCFIPSPNTEMLHRDARRP
jgi:hypothetical protein